MRKLLGLFLFLVVLYALLLIADPGARTEQNHKNIAKAIGLYGIISLGAGILIISGGIDLSIGAVVGFCSTAMAMLLVHPRLGWHPLLAIAAVLGVGAAVGLVNGLVVTRLKVQPFVVTLCGLFIYRGLARWIAGDQVQGLKDEFQTLKYVLYSYDKIVVPTALIILALVASLATVVALAFSAPKSKNGRAAGPSRRTLWFGTFGGTLAVVLVYMLLLFRGETPDVLLGMFQVPMFLVIFLILAALASVFLHFSVYGRYLLAIGSNEQAARYAGVRTDRFRLLAYVLCSMLAAWFGILFLMEQNSAQPSETGSFFELYAIAGAVLGGCSLRGGEGSIPGIMIGAAILWILPNFTRMWGVSNELKYTVIGTALLIGALLDEILRRGAAARK